MTPVSPEEHDLLSLARAVFGLAAFEDVEPLLGVQKPALQGLAPPAMAVLEDTLARGGVLWLMRAGGGRLAASLQGGEIRVGRLWERHPPPALRFSAVTFEVLRWLTSRALSGTDRTQLHVSGAPTPADELFLYATCALLDGSEYARALARQGLFRSALLCRLGFAASLGENEPLPALPDLQLAPLTVLIEGLQGDLARRWLNAERRKAERFSPQELQRMGASQDVVLEEVLSAADRLGRRDLCGFLVEAAVHLLAVPPSAATFTEGLDATAPLRDRQEARRAAGALLRAVGRLRAWDQEHRAVRFIDDGYAGAQRLVQEWEQLGDRGFRLAEELHQALQALC